MGAVQRWKQRMGQDGGGWDRAACVADLVKLNALALRGECFATLGCVPGGRRSKAGMAAVLADHLANLAKDRARRAECVQSGLWV